MKMIWKRIRKIIAMLLVIGLLSTCCVFGNGQNNLEEYRITETYWTKNANVLERIFNVSPMKDSIYRMLDRITVVNGECVYRVIIGNVEIALSGHLYEEKKGEDIYYTGTLINDVVIDDITVNARAVIVYNTSNNSLTAGITIAPKDAKSLDEYAFFSIGDKLDLETYDCTKEELETKFSTSGEDNSFMTRLNMGNRGFTLKSYQYQYLTPVSAGYGQQVQLWYNPAYKRATVATYSYTNNVANYYTSGNDQVAYSYVDTLQIGLKPTTNGAHAVDGFYDFPYTVNPPTNSNIFNNNYIDTLAGIIVAYLKPSITSLALNAFRAVLATCGSKTNASTSWLMTGSNTYVYMDYAQTYINHSYIKYDNAPMSVSFDVKAATSGTYSFTGYSNISYFVFISDYINQYTSVISVSVPQASAPSSNIVINNNQ
jgi:hypothetical protein